MGCVARALEDVFWEEDRGDEGRKDLSKIELRVS